MAKKIKKQIKRSMPLFLIFSLVMSSVAIGLVFNFEINVFNDKAGWLASPLARAQQTDTATTSVTVRNAAPYFSVAAAEVPASTSTSPTSIGDRIGFSAQATDPENNDYYLLVCDSAGATAHPTGGQPSCNGTTFCVSTSTLISNTASCTYGPITDLGSETRDWYAYVCDNHATEAVCSDDYSQGADPGNGADSSPMHINRPPYVTAVNTTVDNQDPGGTFTVTASAYDIDILGTADTLDLYVCSSNVFSTSTGCAGDTWCSTLGDASPDVSCNFATGTPAIDGAWQYYPFVVDSHDLQSTSTPATGTYNVNNVAPTISNLTIHGGVDIRPNIKFASEIVATTSATITDNNTCADIQGATGTIYYSGLGADYQCSADDDNCYKITGAACYISSGCVAGTAQMTYTCSTTIAFHAVPTDLAGNNPYTGTWLGAVTGRDEQYYATGSTSPGVEMLGVLALDVNETDIPFGTLRSGTSTGWSLATTTIENYGNTPIDNTFQGDDMDRQGGGAYIGALNQKYATSTTYYDYLTWTLASTSASAARDVAITRPTTAAQDVTDEVYWGIYIPGSKPSGVYEGFNTVAAALDDNDW